MRTLLRPGLSAAILVLVILADTRQAAAKPDYTRRTRKDCSFCHVPPGYTLNDAGRYYAAHKYSLKGYEPPKPKPDTPSR